MNYLDEIELKEMDERTSIETIADRVVSELIDPSVAYELSPEQEVALVNSVIAIINEEL